MSAGATKSSVPVQKSKGWNPSPWSLLCLIVGIVLPYAHPAFIFISGALFLACFILSIIAIAKHRVISAILLLVAVCTVATVAVLAYSLNASNNAFRAARAATLAKLNCENLKSYREGEYMYLTGAVRNNGGADVSLIKVVVEWRDSDDKVLETDFGYVTGDDKIGAGAAKSFEFRTLYNSKMSKYTYRIAFDDPSQ